MIHPANDARRASGAVGVLNVPRAFWWGAFFLVWTLQVALYAVVSYYRERGTPNPLSWQEAIAASALDWYLWAAITLRQRSARAAATGSGWRMCY
ncbi:MAG: hypothetical protein WD766_14825 [Gemmatimonadota bacterium]